MSVSSRLPHSFWTIAPLAALGFLFWLTNARLHRVDYVTNLVGTEVTVDPASPTGHAGGLRQLIVPEHNNESYQWIVQTQQMLARSEWRVRHVGYDNAPIGRTVLTPSPYRWWLGLVAEVYHLMSGRPAGLSVEGAARLADPALHALLLLGAVIFVAWRFGIASAGLLSAAVVMLFPFGGAFLPGQPGDDGLVLLCALWSVLLPLAGVCPPNASPRTSGPGPGTGDRSATELQPDTRRTARWFFAGGVAGGIGLWIDVARTIPVLAGIALGGAIAAWCARRAIKSGSAAVAQAALPWRHWALGGAVTSLAVHLLEYSPAYLGSLDLREVHPLYGLVWLGVGELLARFTACLQPGVRNIWRTLTAVGLAVLAVSAVPVVLVVTGSRDLLSLEPTAVRLTNLAGSPVAQDLWTWILHDGITREVVATCLPSLLLAPAAWLLARRDTDWSSRAMLALGFGPALVALGFAYFRLRGWNAFDAVLLGLLVALIAATQRAWNSKLGFWTGIVGVLLVLTPGAVLLVDKALADRRVAVTEGDVEALIERDLAHWLARQAGPDGAVVLASPNLTTSLIYHGGLSGLGTPFSENKDGLLAAMRIAGASSPDEAQAVARGRNLNYIVVPSWDNFLDEYARLGANQAEHTLMASLHRWLPPRWLQPVPYHLPKVAGFEEQSVAVFQVVEVQDNATALSHLAEYFVEMDMIEKAASVAATLEHSFPADLGAAVARALVARAEGDAPAFGRALADVQASLARGDGESLPWDRRVSLAIALVEGRHFDLAREQARRCLGEMDEPRLRSLMTISLHRLLEMNRGFGLEIGDPRLRKLAQQLLPAELRDRP
jgi:hypothetical protein